MQSRCSPFSFSGLVSSKIETPWLLMVSLRILDLVAYILELLSGYNELQARGIKYGGSLAKKTSAEIYPGIEPVGPKD
jgi:hypothetical protein